MYWLPHADPTRPNQPWETDLILSEMRDLTGRIQDSRVTISNLANLSPINTPEYIDSHLERQSKIDTQIHMRTPNFDLQDADTHNHFSFRYAQNKHCAQRLWRLVHETTVSNWVSHNGSAVEFGVLQAILRAKSQDVAHIEFGWRETDTILTRNRPFAEFDTKAAWTAHKAKSLSARDLESVTRRAAELEDPESYRSGWVGRFQVAKPESDTARLRTMLGLKDDHPIVLLLGHVEWDTTALVDEANTIFSGSRDWIAETLRYFRANEQLQLLIRPHPQESEIKSRARLEDTVRQIEPDLPHNIHVLSSDAPINTYGLMRMADIGITYLTDAGYEMVMRGRPVICAGRAKFHGKEITLDPSTQEEYFSILDEFTRDPTEFQVDQTNLENAFRFADLYWNGIYKPFPWRPAGIWGQLKSAPMKEIISANNLGKYQEALSVLSGDFEAYDGVVGDLSSLIVSGTDRNLSSTGIGRNGRQPVDVEPGAGVGPIRPLDARPRLPDPSGPTDGGDTLQRVDDARRDTGSGTAIGRFRSLIHRFRRGGRG